MAIQDYTTYIEIDPNNRFTVTPNIITVTDLQRIDNCGIYKDFGANSIGDFTTDVSVTTPAYLYHSWCMLWGISNGSYTYQDQWDNNDGFNVAVWSYAGVIRIVLNNMETHSAVYYDGSPNTNYYLTIRRSGAALTCEIYSDPARTVLLATLSRSSSTAYRYVLAAGSRDDGVSPVACSLAIFNLDLDMIEAVGLDYRAPYALSFLSVEDQVFEDEEIRDVLAHNSAVGDCRYFNVITILVVNGLDQNVSVQVKGNRANSTTGAVDIGDAFNVATVDREARTMEPTDEGFLPFIFIEVTAAGVPTTGDLNAYLIKKPI